MNAPVHFDAAADALSIPLDKLDVSNPKLYQDDIWYPNRLQRSEQEFVAHPRAGLVFSDAVFAASVSTSTPSFSMRLL